MSSILKDKPVQVNREEILQNFVITYHSNRIVCQTGVTGGPSAPQLTSKFKAPFPAIPDHRIEDG